MVRCNLTVVYEPGEEDLIDFYRENRVELICSLPCYLEENVNAQRGDGVFEKSIRALRDLNEAGFGPPGGDLPLNLVYNPVDDHLPPPRRRSRRTTNENSSAATASAFTVSTPSPTCPSPVSPVI